MNRDQLISAATKDIEAGDHGDPVANYLAAIAKLLLAQTLPRDATASPSPGAHLSKQTKRTLSDLLKGSEIERGFERRPWQDWGEDENR